MSQEKNIVLHILRAVSDRMARKGDEQYWTERGFFTIDQTVEISLVESAREQFRNGERAAKKFALREFARCAGSETDKIKTFLASFRIFSAFCYEQAAEQMQEEREHAPDAKYNTVKGSRTLTRNGRAWKQNARVGYRTNIKLDQ